MFEQKMVASYDYDPLKQSPSKDKSKELNLRKGQYVTVIGDMVNISFKSCSDHRLMSYSCSI